MIVRTLALRFSRLQASSMGVFPKLLEPGTRLDRYELVCPIGQGGMASVWVARLRGKRGFENLVAIKTVLPQHAGDSAFERMFVDEARIMAGIRHPNVASVLDVGETDGLLYLVFEWVLGEQLSVLARSARSSGKEFDLPIALRIMADACAGLHAAHQQCGSDGALLMIVHRDVSPQNIMVTMAGGVKVIDFGVAKALHRLAGETEAGIIKGKLSYLAPEMARGEPIDRRVDVWAAGVVLYELIAGRLPVEGETRPATVLQIARGQRAAPLPDHIPRSIASVVEQALEPCVNDRFQTAGEMNRALEGALVKEFGPVTGEDVAAYMARHLGSQINERARRISCALEARPAARESMTSIVDDSSPAVSIGETSLGELEIQLEHSDTAHPGTVLELPPPAPGRARRRAIFVLPLVLVGALAVAGAALARRDRAVTGADSKSSAEHSAALPAPVASTAETAVSAPVPTNSIAAAAEAPPAVGSALPPAVSSALPSQTTTIKQPSSSPPRRKSEDPRSVFGKKR